jgi:hypothetical protein
VGRREADGPLAGGAPALARDKDDPALAADPQRNNNFTYAKTDPYGYATLWASAISGE